MKNSKMYKILILLSAIFTLLWIEPCPADKKEEQKAFNEVLKEQMPLTPDQIEQLLQLRKDREKVMKGKPGKIRVHTIGLDVEPGMIPPEIIMLPGYTTSLSFFDETGAPWPIEKGMPGNVAGFTIEEPHNKKKKNNTVSIHCQGLGHSTLTVELSGMDFPLIFLLLVADNTSESPEIDGVVTVKINDFGPEANPPVLEPRPKDAVTSDMISFLDGVAPQSAVLLKIEPSIKKTSAWYHGEKMFLRTEYPLIWPAWMAAVRGAGKIRVYELPHVETIMLSLDGDIERVAIKELKGEPWKK